MRGWEGVCFTYMHPYTYIASACHIHHLTIPKKLKDRGFMNKNIMAFANGTQLLSLAKTCSYDFVGLFLLTKLVAYICILILISFSMQTRSYHRTMHNIENGVIEDANIAQHVKRMYNNVVLTWKKIMQLRLYVRGTTSLGRS